MAPSHYLHSLQPTLLLSITCCLLLSAKKWLLPSLAMQLWSPLPLFPSFSNLLELFVRFKNLLVEWTSSMFMPRKREQQVGMMSLGIVKLGIVMDLVSRDSWDHWPTIMFLDLIASATMKKIVYDFIDFNVLACCLDHFQWKKWGLES